MSAHPLLHTPALPENRGDNSGTAAKKEMPEGRRFQAGQSGNPKGRPKGIARKVRQVLGDDDGETLARFWSACLTGLLVHVDGDGVRHEEKVDMKDRIAVSKILAERGWGKPPVYAPMEDEDPLDLSERSTAEIAASFERRIDELAARRSAREAVEAPAADG